MTPERTPPLPPLEMKRLHQLSIPGLTSVPAFILHCDESHKGPSVHSGHYVAHICKGGSQCEWDLINDKTVVKADAASESVKDLK